MGTQPVARRSASSDATAVRRAVERPCPIGANRCPAFSRIEQARPASVDSQSASGVGLNPQLAVRPFGLQYRERLERAAGLLAVVVSHWFVPSRLLLTSRFSPSSRPAVLGVERLQRGVHPHASLSAAFIVLRCRAQSVGQALMDHCIGRHRCEVDVTSALWPHRLGEDRRTATPRRSIRPRQHARRTNCDTCSPPVGQCSRLGRAQIRVQRLGVAARLRGTGPTQ